MASSQSISCAPFTRVMYGSEERTDSSGSSFWCPRIFLRFLCGLPVCFSTFENPGANVTAFWVGLSSPRWPSSPRRAREITTQPRCIRCCWLRAQCWEQWPRWAKVLNWAGLAVAAGLGIILFVPLAPVNSRLFQVASRSNGDLREEIGWPELVDTVAKIRDSLPAEERSTAGILTGNYGEAGAIDLYGPAHGLPQALSIVNSFWLRGYGDHPPRTLIVVGLSQHFVHNNFASCESRGMIFNRYGVANEETKEDKYLWVCRDLREPWPDFWRKVRAWGWRGQILPKRGLCKWSAGPPDNRTSPRLE